MNPPDDRNPARLDWVVHLRGVAALWVLSYHLWHMCGRNPLPLGFENLYRAGQQGVDLFFVLSGFVIAWPYVTHRRTKLTWPEVTDFYRRRFFRIAPVYYLSIVAALVLGYYGLLKESPDGKTVLLHFLFAQNFWPDTVAAIRGVYWTLPTEIWFYLFFPLILRFVRVEHPLRIVVVALAFTIGYRMFTLWAGRHGVWLAWTTANLVGRLDQFALGIAAACMVATALHRGKTVPGPAVAASVLAALAAAVWVAWPDPEPFGWRFLVGPSILGLAIAVVLWCIGVRYGAPGAGWRFPGSRWLYAIGLASLSLYIWHTFFIDLADWAGKAWQLTGTRRRNLMLLSGIAAILFSFLSYRAIEKPFVDWSKRRRAPVAPDAPAVTALSASESTPRQAPRIPPLPPTA